MDHREEYRETGSSPRSYTDSQKSPAPRSEEYDQIYTAQGSPPQAHFRRPHSPPGASPPFPQYEYSQQEHHHSSPDLSQTYANYQEGYSTEKETPLVLRDSPSISTPDYSRPQVVPGQFPQYPHGGRPFSSSSNGGTTLTSPLMRPCTFKEHVDSNELISQPGTVPPPVPPKDRFRKCGMKRRSFFILIGCILIWVLALALGIGFGLGLGLENNSNTNVVDPFCREQPQYCIGGSLNANYLSRKGVYNGTGIALAGESWTSGRKRIFTLYFQHHTGDIRFMQYTTDRKWIGGTRAETVVTDAKNASPISTVSYQVNSTRYFHIFYIDQSNLVKQVTKTNGSDIWQPGPLSDLKLKAMDSPSVGLQACWNGNYYGDSDYTKFSTSSGQINQQTVDERLGMNVWFAVDDSTFQQYAWYNGQNTWVSIQRWQGFNGHAGVACYSWGEGTTTYAMMANKNNNVESWWRDTNTSTTSTENHPINSWQNSTSGAIQGVHPMTSLGYTTYFYAQMADRSVKGYNITLQAENTTFSQDNTFSITDPAGPALGIGGTHITVTAYTAIEGNTTLWDSLYVFYQTAGDDITAFTRPLKGGEWTRGSLTIPDT